MKEESRNLQDEVKLKRRGLRSLHKAVERASQETISSVAKHDNPKTEDAMQQHVCLFVAFPDGSCMELLALPHWTIKMIDEFVRKKFPSKIIRSSNGSEHNYYHRGTLLPNDLTVRDCGISNQDTINMVTVIDLVNESTTIGVGKISENEPDDKIVGVVNQQMQVLQQLALDIRYVDIRCTIWRHLMIIVSVAIYINRAHVQNLRQRCIIALPLLLKRSKHGMIVAIVLLSPNIHKRC